MSLAHNPYGDGKPPSGSWRHSFMANFDRIAVVGLGYWAADGSPFSRITA